MKKNYLKTILRLILDFIGIIILIILLLIFLLWKDTWNPYSHNIDNDLIPKFQKFELDNGHTFDTLTSLPVRGSMVIDIDNDGIEEIFLWWGAWQSDQIFAYENDNFIDISEKYNIEKDISANTLAASSLDIDNNGFTDMIISRETWLFIYYNNWNSFEKTEVSTWINEKSTPLWITLWDINKDWFIDIFLSTYIKKAQIEGLTNFAEWYGSKSELLLNNWDNTFKNITNEAWLDYVHNTFQWIFVDLDNDTWLDLVVAYDTWEPRIYKNNGDTTFSLKSNPYTWKFAYPMWIAVWDYNNDGFVDVFFSNIGSTLPKTIVKWNLDSIDDLELGWFLFENKWDFIFNDVSKETKVRNYEFSWWAVFADMNNDGREDLIVAENFIDLSFQKLFKLPGRLLIQDENNIFTSTEKQSGVSNKYFWITPLVSDFNSDGFLDLVWVNLSEPSFAFINNWGTQNFLQVSLPDNSQSIWAKIIVTLTSWDKLTQDYITWEWLTSDQTSIVHFWLWNNTSIKTLEIKYINKDSEIIENPEINTILKIAQ